MRFQEIEVPVPESMRWLGNIIRYEAHLDFGDYEKLFQFMRWRCPQSFHCYGNPYVEGIEGYCHDGTTMRIGLLEFRDTIDRYWRDLKTILSEGEDLSRYSEEIGHRETLTLKCTTLVFKTGQCTCCSFDRIWGKLRW